jgi:hypothetical protein
MNRRARPRALSPGGRPQAKPQAAEPGVLRPVPVARSARPAGRYMLMPYITAAITTTAATIVMPQLARRHLPPAKGLACLFVVLLRNILCHVVLLSGAGPGKSRAPTANASADAVAGTHPHSPTAPPPVRSARRRAARCVRQKFPTGAIATREPAPSKAARQRRSSDASCGRRWRSCST